MREFQVKRKMHMLLYSKFTIGVLVILFLLLSSALWGVYGKYAETKKNRELALEKLHALREQENYVRNEITRLEEDRGVEEEIRKKFGFVKDGEGVIIITEPPSANQQEIEGGNQGLLGAFFESIRSLFR